jgi:hypothetical protein
VGEERGIPRVKGGKMRNIRIVIDVCGQVVGDGGLGARTKVLSFCLKVRECGLDFGGKLRELETAVARN